MSDVMIGLVLAACAGCAWLLLRLCAALLPAPNQATSIGGGNGASPVARTGSGS